MCVWLRHLYYTQNYLTEPCSCLHVQKDSCFCIQGQQYAYGYGDKSLLQNTAENYWNGTCVLSTLRKLGIFA